MRILIADDSQAVRRAIRAFLSKEPGWDICGEAADGPETLEKARALLPDLVLLDINMPVASGLETARRIRQGIPQVKMLILSHEDAAHLLPIALEAGADGCVDKSRIPAELIPAIRKLVGGTVSGAAH
jgi:DNA-binding NarL/FixJ family response regulator